MPRRLKKHQVQFIEKYRAMDSSAMKMKHESTLGRSELELHGSISMDRKSEPLRPVESETERQLRQKIIDKRRDITSLVSNLRVSRGERE